MSFNELLLYLLLVVISSCGVKGPPEIPTGTAIPSYVDQFLIEAKTASSTTN